MDETLEKAPPRNAGRRTQSESAGTLRRLLLAVLAFGMAGMAAELLLLGHTEEAQQWIPLITLAIGLVSTAVLALRPTRGSVLAMRIVMIAFVVAAIAGLYFHYSGNVEFELEMYPSIRGMELFRKSITGATPALAPGMLAQLGLLGLAITWKHPALRR